MSGELIARVILAAGVLVWAPLAASVVIPAKPEPPPPQAALIAARADRLTAKMKRLEAHIVRLEAQLGPPRQTIIVLPIQKVSGSRQEYRRAVPKAKPK